MPSKKNPESQKEQSERFKKTVADLVAAGELNPTEADKAFDKLMGNVKLPKN
jgi:polyhydroxyalkanoate synthesis regulator phasin